MKLSTNELLHRRWNEALPGDRATRDGVIYQLSEKGEWLYVEDPYDGQSIRAHKDHAIEAEAVAAERARIRALDYRMVEWYHADGSYSLVQVVARSEAIGGSADAD